MLLATVTKSQNKDLMLALEKECDEFEVNAEEVSANLVTDTKPFTNSLQGGR